MTNPLISVIMASYNHVEYLSETVESVWCQNYPNIELVVVDDASTDGSAELLKTLKKNSPIPMHIYFNEKNCGPSFTIARAFNLSNGELIAFLASDDLYAPDRFKNQVQCYLDPDMLLVFADGLILNSDGTFGANLHKNIVRDLLRKPANEILRFLYTHSSPFFLQSALVHRTLLEGSFDQSSIADDWITNILMFKKLCQGGKFAFIDEVVCYYRVHGENLHKNVGRQIALKEQVIQRYTPTNLRREALANIYWKTGMSLVFNRPLKSLRYLFLSQINQFRPFVLLRLFQSAIWFMLRKSRSVIRRGG